MAETTIDARVTMYGFPDNDPPFSANIAHPVLHQQASGIGTFDDPITFAGDPRDTPFGTKIYVPHVQKYFIMEDTCADAIASPNDGLQVDLWAGGSANTDVQQILSVESANTRSSAQIILNADPGHPVNLTPFDGSPTPSTGAQTPAAGRTTSVDYQGRTTSVDYHMDDGSRVIYSYDVNNTQSYSQAVFVYNANGKATLVDYTMHDGGRQIYTFDADGGSHVYAYDTNNSQAYQQVVFVRDASGRTTTVDFLMDDQSHFIYNYDAAGQAHVTHFDASWHLLA